MCTQKFTQNRPTYPARWLHSCSPLQLHSYILSLFLYKSFADPVIQCRPIAAYVLVGLTTEALPRGKENFRWPLVIRLFSDVSRCSECRSQAQHIKGTAGTHLLSYFLHCSQPCCVRIRQPLPVSLGKENLTDYLWDYLCFQFQLSHLPWTYICASCSFLHWKEESSFSRKQQCWILWY